MSWWWWLSLGLLGVLGSSALRRPTQERGEWVALVVVLVVLVLQARRGRA